MSVNGRGVVRQAVGTGRWFPGNRRQLESVVREFVDSAHPPAVPGRIAAIISPHAGYVYSGRVAGYAFKAVKEKSAAGLTPETVVVLGFSHSRPVRGLALMDGDSFETPLGRTRMDAEAVQLLLEHCPDARCDCHAFGDEHSTENQVPFIQSALPQAGLVMALAGSHDLGFCRDVAQALLAVNKTRKLLVVASSDMLHDPDYELVTRTDKATLKKLETMDHAGLLSDWSYARQIFCGIGPVLIAMLFAGLQGCRAAMILHYRNSGDDFPESRGSWVVGYGAVAFAVQEH